MENVISVTNGFVKLEMMFRKLFKLDKKKFFSTHGNNRYDENIRPVVLGSLSKKHIWYKAAQNWAISGVVSLSDCNYVKTEYDCIIFFLTKIDQCIHQRKLVRFLADGIVSQETEYSENNYLSNLFTYQLDE